jgi:methionyl-tRNA synthetase
MSGNENSDRLTYYITTPIYYVNDNPHIGHVYTTLACDVLARFMRLDGRRVKFLTGTDEHGQKVERAARERGMEPQAFTDTMSQNFRDLSAAWDFSNDDFIRTTENRHVRACQDLWRRLVDAGQIYLDTYAGWYAVRDEAFYGEDELTTGPDGKKYAPSGAVCDWVEEPSYFFKLSEWQQPLLDFYEANPDFIGPSGRRNEVLSFVRGGLRDLSVSRTTFAWGVPVPDDPDHIMYVWLDALTNYLTAVGYPDTNVDEYRAFWPADLHMVGKDILRFHAVYWPAFLLAAGIAPPERVFAHGWWTNEGQKISKSLGNVIDPYKLIDDYGLDQTRYYMLREVPFGNDGDFAHRAMINRINDDLANDLGNLAQRSLSMIYKNCGAAIPEPGKFTESDRAMLDAADAMVPRARPEMEQQAFHRALAGIWEVVAQANRYVDEQAPWVLRKTDQARMSTVLYVLADVVRQLAIVTQPFMTRGPAALLDQINQATDARDFAALATRIEAGRPIQKPQGVFPRFVAEESKSAS